MNPITTTRPSLRGASNSPVPSVAGFRAYRGVIPYVPVKSGVTEELDMKREPWLFITPEDRVVLSAAWDSVCPYVIGIAILGLLLVGAIVDVFI